MNSGKRFKYYFLTIIILTIFSCGKAPQSTLNPIEKNISTTNEIRLSDEGSYESQLKDGFSYLESQIEGFIAIQIKNKKLFLNSYISGLVPNQKYYLAVMEGMNCPEITNGDEVDFTEVIKTTGKILIPIDSDLSNQIKGSQFGPLANAHGNIYFKRSGSFPDIWNDLFGDDLNPGDLYVKLDPSQILLNLHKRVVLIYTDALLGNDHDVGATYGDEPSLENYLPVLCHQLKRVN